MKNLFQWGKFESASGRILDWKIECDALTQEDWDCIARASLPLIGEFGHAVGVPQGGMALARALAPHADPKSAILLLVDDVWTTGASMRSMLGRIVAMPDWKGFVAFARADLPSNVKCFMQVSV